MVEVSQVTNVPTLCLNDGEQINASNSKGFLVCNHISFPLRNLDSLFGASFDQAFGLDTFEVHNMADLPNPFGFVVAFHIHVAYLKHSMMAIINYFNAPDSPFSGHSVVEIPNSCLKSTLLGHTGSHVVRIGSCEGSLRIKRGHRLANQHFIGFLSPFLCD